MENCSDSEGKDSGTIQSNASTAIVERRFPQKSPIDREQARMLAISVGLHEASRQTGLNINTLKAWSSRFSWFGAQRKQPYGKPHATIATKAPAEALADALADMSRKTKVQLAKVALRSARSVKSVPVKSARDLKDLQTAAAGVHGWNDASKGESGITLNVLNVQGDLIQG